MTRFYFLLSFLFIPIAIFTQTLINTSFESSEIYTVGALTNQNGWKVTSGVGEITSNAEYVRNGAQAIKISSTSTAIQTDHIAFASNAAGLGGDVYLDFWIKLKALSSANFAITGYDLCTDTHRSFMMEFLPTGKIKLYDGTSGWTTQLDFTVDTWKRISIKIDNIGAKCQYAIDGVVINKLFAFREIRNAATEFNYHSIRFSMSSGTADVAVDNMYIGSTPISNIAFQSTSTDRTIHITQPPFAQISLSPSKSMYQLNDVVSASIAIPDHYLFTGWTGDLSGTQNPISFTVDKNYAIGATVIVDPANPPVQSTITVNQPIGGTIALSPQQASYYNGTSVTATMTVQSGYQFNSWSGSLSGTINPTIFTVNDNMTIGASVSEIQVSSTKRIVSTVTQFKDALAAMNPGDTVLVLDGTYNLGGVKVTRGGSSLKPIVVISKNLHGAKIIGASSFSLSGISFVTFSSFLFDVEPVSTILKLEGCSNVRITRNILLMKNLTDTQTSKWITVGDVWENEVCNSHHNRIDHNLFDGKYDQGAWIIIDGSHGAVPAISQHDLIDHNIFRNNTPRVTNEKETIRLGVSDLSHKDAFAVVEYNLFEDCDGDPEIVSVKSNCDTVRNNTFRRCLGTISLRQGNNSVVEGNFIFGEGKTTIFDGGTIGCGGVRVYGLNHKITNNYFEGLTGSKWDAACTLTNGDVTNTSTSLSSHFLPENIEFAFNTLVNNKSNIEIGFDNNASYGKAPINCKIVNNIIVANENPIVKYYSATSFAGVNFQNNIMYSTGSATLGLTGITDSQIKTVDPQLVQSDCRAYGQNCDKKMPVVLYKLSASSPAINASVGYASIIYDFEKQPSIGIRDIGADEFNAVDEIRNGPLSEEQVGPTAPEFYTYEHDATGIITLRDNPIIIALSNPFSGSTMLTISSKTPESGIISIRNSLGQLIQTDQIDLTDNKTNYILRTVEKGILFCSVALLKGTTTIRLISK
ncbi:MAG: chondroitinase-B domain-containing protein [Bacteroidales bacterium]|nr:chondroitinase-B domain-containing protein [Bacteroidales bacterium]